LKTQQLELGNSDLGVGKRMTRDTSHRVKILRTSGVGFSMNLEVKPSQHEEPRKTSILKAQQVFHAESVFHELVLVMIIRTSSKGPCG
jgi:hypothetical protein